MSLPPILTLALALTLTACSRTENPASPPPAGATPAAAPAATTSAAVPAAPAHIPLRCEDASLSEAGQYIGENNAWGKQGVVGWSQCMGATEIGRAHV
jgi:hypothetical protein